MCGNCYEKYVERSEKTMLFCKLKSKEMEQSELLGLCTCQRFCSDKDKYIPYKQISGCKYYV